MMFNKNNIKGFITPHQKRAWWMHNNIKIFIVLLAINIILFVFSSIIEPNFIQNLKNEQYKYALEVLNLYLEENVDTSYALYMFRDDLSSYAKEKNIPFIIVGHINKEGSLAGPKVLEHIVDTVLQFEGDQHYVYRILRAQKNRFGSTSELGIFEMQQDGLREVSNPSELLLSNNRDGLSGIAIAAAVEGVRPLLIEVQALVASAAYGTPQRSSTGFDARRLNMLLAVLEKRVGFKLLQKDVFVNIAGGIRVNDPAIDMAVLAAVLSSNMDVALDEQTCITGEVGLAGEIRPVNRIDQRIREAEKLGFKTIIVPKGQKYNTQNLKIKVVEISRVVDAFKFLFKK